MMAVVTASLTDSDGVPLRRIFVEHILRPGDISLGWSLTDRNGSFTFDASVISARVDVRVHCRNSVIRVVEDSDSIPGTSSIFTSMNVGHGETVPVGSFANQFRILSRSQDVYDTVWRQFRPYNRSTRLSFPLGRKGSDVRRTFAESYTCEAVFPDNFPIATLTFVEAAGVFNNHMPILHLKSDSRLFGTSGSDPSLLPHELGHVFHFAALRTATRILLEASYLGYLTNAAATGQPTTHEFDQKTNPLVAFVEAAGIFSERFFFFAKRVEPNLRGEDLRRAFFRDELSDTRSLPTVLNDECPRAGQQSGTVVTPSLIGASSIEGAVYGAIYLDFARRVGLREAVGLVLDSNASTFAEFKTYVHGRGNNAWANAIDAVEITWEMDRI